MIKNCLHCNISFETKRNRVKFCSQSCGAIFNNLKRGIESIKYPICICLFCSNQFKKTKNKTTYCTHKCATEHKKKKSIDSWFENPEEYINSRPFMKTYIIDTIGYNCQECGINEWNGKSLSLELEHKDGNSENNKLENLCLLCPNCHSQTETYKAKNKGNGRYSRKERYRSGKSY